MRVSVDIGGTFTDCVVEDASGMRLFKSPTTPADPPRGVLDVLSAPPTTSRSPPSSPASTASSTGRRWRRTFCSPRPARAPGMLTTAGFRDVIEIRRGFRNLGSSMFDQFKPPYRALVPRSRRLAMPERVAVHGRSRARRSTYEAAATAVDRLLGDGCEAIAICFLHSYAAPENERARPRSRPATQPRHLRHLLARDPADARRVRAFLDHRGERVHRAVGLELSLRPRAAPARRRAWGDRC